MRKVRSFSQYGANLERRSSLTTDPELLTKLARRSREKPLVVQRPEAKFIEGFNRVTSRQKTSGFQNFHTRDKHTNTNYEVKQNLIRTSQAFYTPKKEHQPRLKKQIPSKEKYEQNENPCNRHSHVARDQTIMTSKDLQKSRKSFHNMDFDKQLAKSHSYIKKPEGRETLNAQDWRQMGATHKSNAITKIALDKSNPLFRAHSVHSFASYTNRDFLSQKKLMKKGGPPTSGIDSYKIPQQKFKGGWKVVQPPKFETLAAKTLSRYDGEHPWHTKLGYTPKEELVIKKTLVFDMASASPRKLNQVHSKYPIRGAV